MKRVFITGGTTGIGKALAQEYLAKGDQVGICGKSSEKFWENFVAHENLDFYQVDVVEREQIKQALNSFSSKRSGVDIVIANAGIGFSKKTQWPNFEIIKKIFDVNLNGVLNTVEIAIELMREKGGQIVLLSSTAGMVGLPGTGAYSASKAAVMKLGEAFSLDLTSLGISFTTILPGFVDTPLTQQNHHPMPFILSSEKAAQRMIKAIEKKKVFYAFPKRNYFVAKFMSMIPRSFYYRLMTLPFLNYSIKEKK